MAGRRHVHPPHAPTSPSLPHKLTHARTHACRLRNPCQDQFVFFGDKLPLPLPNGSTCPGRSSSSAGRAHLPKPLLQRRSIAAKRFGPGRAAATPGGGAGVQALQGQASLGTSGSDAPSAGARPPVAAPAPAAGGYAQQQQPACDGDELEDQPLALRIQRKKGSPGGSAQRKPSGAPRASAPAAQAPAAPQHRGRAKKKTKQQQEEEEEAEEETTEEEEEGAEGGSRSHGSTGQEEGGTSSVDTVEDEPGSLPGQQQQAQQQGVEQSAPGAAGGSRGGGHKRGRRGAAAAARGRGARHGAAAAAGQGPSSSAGAGAGPSRPAKVAKLGPGPATGSGHQSGDAEAETGEAEVDAVARGQLQRALQEAVQGAQQRGAAAQDSFDMKRAAATWTFEGVVPHPPPLQPGEARALGVTFHPNLAVAYWMVGAGRWGALRQLAPRAAAGGAGAWGWRWRWRWALPCAARASAAPLRGPNCLAPRPSARAQRAALPPAAAPQVRDSARRVQSGTRARPWSSQVQLPKTERDRAKRLGMDVADIKRQVAELIGLDKEPGRELPEDGICRWGGGGPGRGRVQRCRRSAPGAAPARPSPQRRHLQLGCAAMQLWQRPPLPLPLAPH
jgi:hypothetical protein